MENNEISMEELDSIYVGNDAIHQLVALSTSLLNNGYTKEEVRNAVAQKFDLTNPILSNNLELLLAEHENKLTPPTKKM